MTKIESIFDTFIDALEKERIQQDPQALYDPVNYILTIGGKRIRPLLCLVACEMLGGTVEEALNGALAVEVFHNFTLMHDDIMDEAPLRRGKMTVHEKYGLSSAILSGDVMLVRSYQYLTKYPPALQPPLFEILTEVAIGVCEGQQMDMDFETRDDVSVAEYIEMIRLKTSVLLGGSLKMGALIAGADASTAQKLYDYGVYSGIAFQLNDDFLDVYADQAKFGKQVGGDIIRNKKTYLLLKALALAEGEQKEQLQDWLSKMDFEEAAKVAAVTDIYNQLKIPEYTKALSQEYYEKANEAFKSIELPAANKRILTDYMDWVMHRTF